MEGKVSKENKPQHEKLKDPEVERGEIPLEKGGKKKEEYVPDY